MNRIALSFVYCPGGIDLAVPNKVGNRTGIESMVGEHVDGLDLLPDAGLVEVRMGAYRRYFPVSAFRHMDAEKDVPRTETSGPAGGTAGGNRQASQRRR